MKQYNRAVLAMAFGSFAFAVCVFHAAAAGLDGATIVTSGSTNTAGYTIKIHSDGNGAVAVADRPEKAFAIDPSLARKFMNDAKAARANPGTPQHCMKSASFGTTTTVTWHNYTSGDLQCPPFSAAVAMLAHDAGLIQQAAGVGTGMHRIRLPIEPHRLPPSASAEPNPGVSPSPSMSPSPKSESQRP